MIDLAYIGVLIESSVPHYGKLSVSPAHTQPSIRENCLEMLLNEWQSATEK